MGFKDRVYVNVGDKLEISHNGISIRCVCVEQIFNGKMVDACGLASGKLCALHFYINKANVCAHMQCSGKERPDEKNVAFLEIPFE